LTPHASVGVETSTRNMVRLPSYELVLCAAA